MQKPKQAALPCHLGAAVGGEAEDCLLALLLVEAARAAGLGDVPAVPRVHEGVRTVVGPRFDFLSVDVFYLR